jgi:hypothetical protein
MLTQATTHLTLAEMLILATTHLIQAVMLTQATMQEQAITHLEMLIQATILQVLAVMQVQVADVKMMHPEILQKTLLETQRVMLTEIISEI